MFRIIKYALIFFLGYYLIRKIFGTKTPKEKSPPDTLVNNTPPPVNKGNFDKKSGEYIDYEEIK
jgi:hypothetical protein